MGNFEKCVNSNDRQLFARAGAAKKIMHLEAESPLGRPRFQNNREVTRYANTSYTVKRRLRLNRSGYKSAGFPLSFGFLELRQKFLRIFGVP